MEDKKVMYFYPVAGMTILGAIEKAIKMAKDNDKTVLSEMNDVEMTFTKETKLDEALKVFHERLNALYAEQDKQRQKG